MKGLRVLAALTMAGIFVGGAQSLEWGVDSTTSLQLGNKPSPPTVFEEELFGSLLVPYDQKGGGLEAKAHAWAGVPVTVAADFDVLSFNFVFDKPAPDLKGLKLTVGRYAMADPTGVILNHPGDGFRLNLDYGPLALGIGAGYTGLVMRSTSGISLTVEDQNRANDLLESPRMVGWIEGGTTFFQAHRFTASILAQKDLNPSSNLIPEFTNVQSPARGGTLDTQYFTLKAAGPVVPDLFYEAFTTLGTGSTLSWLSDVNSPTGFSYQYRPIVAFLGGGSLIYFKPEWLEASFTGRILFASGDSSATSPVEGNVANLSTLFLPITTTTLGIVFNPGLSNLVYYEFGGSLKPVPGQPLVTGAKFLGFQRMVSGVVNAPGILRNGPAWLGQEFDVTASWPVFSDLNLTAAVGGFTPTSGTYVKGSTGDTFQYALNFGATLSL